MFYTVSLVIATVLLFIFWNVRKPKLYPPGPRWYPIFGCALQISHMRMRTGMFCKVCDELNKIYENGVFGLKMGRDKLVVAYSANAIKEMMSNEDLDGKPDGIFYRSRTFGARIGILVVDGEFWQEQRRFIMRHLKEFGFARRGMVAVIQNEAQKLHEDIMSTIKLQGGTTAIISAQDLFPVFVLNTLWSMMASIRYDRGHKEVNELLTMFHELLKNVDMVGCLFSHFPFLRFMAPDFSGYTDFVDIHRRLYDFMRQEVDVHRKTLNLNAEPRDLIDCFLHELAKPNHSESFTEEQLLSVCLDMFLAGSETTNKSLTFALLHMVRDPEIQKRAQEELDAIVGRERLPCWDDRLNLPYCEGIVHEALRFFMGHTFGIPHRALCDTKLAGYEIPKDTMVISCFRGMLMSSKHFPNPSKFSPDRYIKNGKLIVPDALAPFGLGKHRCMGELMGRQNLFMFLTTLLQNYTFRHLPGQLPSDEPEDGVTAAIKDFNAIVIPR